VKPIYKFENFRPPEPDSVISTRYVRYVERSALLCRSSTRKFNFETDTKSTVQEHTVCTTQIDTNRHNRTSFNGIEDRTTRLQTFNTIVR